MGREVPHGALEWAERGLREAELPVACRPAQPVAATTSRAMSTAGRPSVTTRTV
ncbi:hypothetical protein AB0B78_24865 [Streptomyces sp. NPDC040724]|uniref:hypothetical protein n=1 Tax=Streptomyces sp. NPDC040724 TaxID=3155612 RepID=UPI00340EC743